MHLAAESMYELLDEMTASDGTILASIRHEAPSRCSWDLAVEARGLDCVGMAETSEMRLI